MYPTGRVADSARISPTLAGTAAAAAMGNAAAGSRRAAPPADITGLKGEKGLLNSVGLHHCFLNVVIQSLWHLKSFRERFIRLPHHEHQRRGLIHDYVAVNTQQQQRQQRTQAERQCSDEDLAVITDAERDEARLADGSPPAPASASPPPPVDASSLADDRDSCVCCALKLIFIHYEHSDSSIIPPDSLRYALSLLLDNHGANKFKMREMSDAEEALDEILKYLHWDHLGMAAIPPPPAPVSGGANEESVLSRSLDIPCAPHTCISHRVFGSQLMDQKICTVCRASSDPEMSFTFLYRMYVSELIALKKQHKEWRLEELLQHSYTLQDYSCPSPKKSVKGKDGRAVVVRCPGRAKIERWALGMPEVFAMMCVWSQAEQERSEIEAFFKLIRMDLQIDRFLRVQPQEESSAGPARNGASTATPDLTSKYQFRGMILYYGRHYLAVFWSQAFRSFVMFDDKRVSNLGTWEQVVERCVKGKLQPTVILYESCNPEVERTLQADIQAADAADAARVEQERLEAKAAATAAPVSPAATSPSPQAPSAQRTSTPIAASAGGVLSPGSQAAANQYFATQTGQPHIIHPPAPSAPSAPSSPPVSGPASTRPPAATSSSPQPSGARTTRPPPAVIPSYFDAPSSSSSSGTGVAGAVGQSERKEDWEEQQERWWREYDAWRGGGSSSDAVHDEHNSIYARPQGANRSGPASGVQFGFASPSQHSRNLQTQGHAREWICLGCRAMWPPAQPLGQCPQCAMRQQPSAQSQHMTRMLAQQQAQQQQQRQLSRQQQHHPHPQQQQPQQSNSNGPTIRR